MKLSVFIGRFSPLHNGHLKVIKHALATSDALLILVGSSGRARDTKNPFTFDERRQMILDAALDVKPDGGRRGWYSKVAPLNDFMYNDSRWIQQVQMEVEKYKNELYKAGVKITEQSLTGSDRDDSTWYLDTFGSYFTKDLVDPQIFESDLSATKVREIMFKSNERSLEQVHILPATVPPSTLRFLEGFRTTEAYADLKKEFEYIEKYKKAWEKAPYAPIFSTVDCCVIQSGFVLVNVRDNFPGRGLYALPGGFVEQNERLQVAAVRELKEETAIGLNDATLLGSIKAKEIFDHPNRSLRGRTITTCFLFRLNDTKRLPDVKPQAGEVKKVMWLPIAEALGSPDKFFEDHYDILSWAVAQI